MILDRSFDCGHLGWHKFIKKYEPEDGQQIIVCRDFGYDPFFVLVTVDCGEYTMNTMDGITEFIPNRRDRWAYVPMPVDDKGDCKDCPLTEKEKRETCQLCRQR